MANKKMQRIGIGFIAIFMILGTVGSLLVVILSIKNSEQDQVRLQEAFGQYQKDDAKQTKELSDKYYPIFKDYADSVAPFEYTSEEVAIKDLKIGEGEKVTKDTEYSAYYIGWNPQGEIFDQSIEKESLKKPILSGGLIEGWREGVIGMKIGGIREITIPAKKAYGEQGSGEKIPPNSPIKFVILAVPQVLPVPMPKILQGLQ